MTGDLRRVMGDLRSRLVFSVPKPPVISLSDRAEERVFVFPNKPPSAHQNL